MSVIEKLLEQLLFTARPVSVIDKLLEQLLLTARSVSVIEKLLEQLLLTARSVSVIEKLLEQLLLTARSVSVIEKLLEQLLLTARSVMYMYYLLGHRIMELPIHIDRKAVIAQNTYILAMDGDVDFQPQAVHLLIDLMKKNDTLGSSCGRIHPIGQGAMAWYQLFEYAVGHWLQKATEHMIGCVLCSPGAFSLFRARALMDDGVMKRYTFTANEPRHYVQYDQGEDRWLCTLLLQQGYRVEYSAASDAYTHCPESFDEFYNQRRRWVPSTMANIFDLLGSAKKTSQINDNISLPYIFYHKHVGWKKKPNRRDYVHAHNACPALFMRIHTPRSIHTKHSAHHLTQPRFELHSFTYQQYSQTQE
uniref:chitin synthase n=1 Tax=Timema douglasi TaxID=61478 RepID=A0A7R8Z6R0_TIMDO|nr:unnamed protein product [Timema douglasi]